MDNVLVYQGGGIAAKIEARIGFTPEQIQEVQVLLDKIATTQSYIDVEYAVLDPRAVVPGTEIARVEAR